MAVTVKGGGGAVGSAGVITVPSLDIQPGDYVLVVAFRNGNQPAYDPGILPGWLGLLSRQQGTGAGIPHTFLAYGGLAASVMPSLAWSDTYSVGATVVVLSGVDPEAVLTSDYTGLTLRGPALIAFMSAQAYYNNFWRVTTGEFVDEQFSPNNDGRNTSIQLRSFSAGATGSFGVEGGASGAWGAGIAVAMFSGSDSPRIRSNVSEDAGSLFQATQAVAVELGISEAFEYGADLGSGLRAFREALTPDEVAARYYPLPTRNQEMLVTVDGETNLGRLASTYPAAIMRPATVIPGASGGVVTAQQAIQHVLDSWANAHSWLTFEAVPDLRLLEPGAVAAPRQHYVDHASAGVLTTVAVVIPQDGTDRRSMRDILDEWLAIFPGTVVRQTSSGSIELVPRVGPDAPVDAALTLTWRDLLAVSDGDADPRGVINRARVTSQGWEFTESQTLAPPAFMLFTGGGGINRDVLKGETVIPTDQEEYQPGRTMPFTVFVDAGSAVTVTVAITAFGSWSPTSSSAFSVEGTASPSATLDVGQSREVSITHNSRSQDVTSRWRLTRISSVAIDVQPISVVASATNVFGSTYFAYLLEFDVVGTAWVRTNESVTGEFGQAGAGLPGEGGGDAIATSRAQYGERLAQLQSNVFQLTIEQAQAVAQSYVLWNINPRTIRDVQQSEWNKFPVKFDHVGRHVDLPTGERAVVENRAYSDSFAPGGGTMQSTFTATVTEVVIDTSTDWLLLDNGDFFALDSGDLVEVS